jgi:hypothetical protein
MPNAFFRRTCFGAAGGPAVGRHFIACECRPCRFFSGGRSTFAKIPCADRFPHGKPSDPLIPIFTNPHQYVSDFMQVTRALADSEKFLDNPIYP